MSSPAYYGFDENGWIEITASSRKTIEWADYPDTRIASFDHQKINIEPINKDQDIKGWNHNNGNPKVMYHWWNFSTYLLQTFFAKLWWLWTIISAVAGIGLYELVKKYNLHDWFLNLLDF